MCARCISIRITRRIVLRLWILHYCRRLRIRTSYRYIVVRVIMCSIRILHILLRISMCMLWHRIIRLRLLLSYYYA